MKLIIALILLVFFKLSAEPTECIKRTKEVFLNEKSSCKSLYGVEKTTCLDTAKVKMRSSNDDCRKKLIECISKAVFSKNESRKLCDKNVELEKANCIKSSNDEFAKAKTNCRSI